MNLAGQSCQWVGGDRQSDWPSLTYSYSSCVLSPGQCPDGQCDGLESLDASLCPQDCVASQNIMMSLLVNTEPAHPRGIPSVKAPNMTCSCDAQSSCQCFHTREEMEVVGAEQVQTRHQDCDDHCILLLTATSSISIALVLLLTAVWRKRLTLCSRYVKDKAKVQQYDEGFSSELDDYSR